MAKVYKNGRILKRCLPEKEHEREFYENDFKEKFPELLNSDNEKKIMDDYVQKQEKQYRKFLEEQKEYWDSDEGKNLNKKYKEIFTVENGAVYFQSLIDSYNEIPVNEAIEQLKTLIYDRERELAGIRVQHLEANKQDERILEELKRELERQEYRLKSEQKLNEGKIEIHQTTAALYFYYMISNGFLSVRDKNKVPPASVGEIKSFIELNNFNINSSQKCYNLYSEMNIKQKQRKKSLQTKPAKGYNKPTHFDLLLKLPNIEKCMDLIQNDLK